MISDSGLSFRFPVPAAVGGVAAHDTVADVGDSDTLCCPVNSSRKWRQVRVPDVDRRRRPARQPDQQDPPVLVEPLQIPVAPVDDLRDEAVSAHEVLQRLAEPLPLIIGVEGVEAVEGRLQVGVQLGVELPLGRVRHPTRARPRPAPG